MMSWYSWAPYVSVAEKRARSLKQLASREKRGFVARPVRVAGRTIARSFWGAAWCANLEAYSDFENRLPRGRSYLRNGSVLHLDVGAGRVDAFVAGSDLYRIAISITPVPVRQWAAIRKESAGKIGSLVELLQGKLSRQVMDVVTRKGTGLFPSPREIEMNCSCPDYAGLCKHLAAVLYAVGARLDEEPELLFLLRGVDHEELIEEAAAAPIAAGVPEAGKALDMDASGLSALFGIDVEEEARPASAVRPPKARSPRKRTERKTASRKIAEAVAIPRKAKRSPEGGAGQLRAGTTVSSKDLAALGIPAASRRNWLMEGVLERTQTTGVYRATRETRARVDRYLERSRAKVDR
jgi:uncharacterized Zn finger protein